MATSSEDILCVYIYLVYIWLATHCNTWDADTLRIQQTGDWRLTDFQERCVLQYAVVDMVLTKL